MGRKMNNPEALWKRGIQTDDSFALRTTGTQHGRDRHHLALKDLEAAIVRRSMKPKTAKTVVDKPHHYYRALGGYQRGVLNEIGVLSGCHLRVDPHDSDDRLQLSDCFVTFTGREEYFEGAEWLVDTIVEHQQQGLGKKEEPERTFSLVETMRGKWIERKRAVRGDPDLMEA
eukprot:m.275972 g.275972  ORF g.275972 m.275972 type:complete len:172 (+) comp121791_c0_seq1:153-668(+)